MSKQIYVVCEAGGTGDDGGAYGYSFSKKKAEKAAKILNDEFNEANPDYEPGTQYFVDVVDLITWV